MEIIMQVSPFNEEIWKFSDLASSEAFRGSFAPPCQGLMFARPIQLLIHDMKLQL